MSGNVASLYGHAVLAVGEVNGELVEDIEWLLERAKSGEIQGLSFVHLNSDGTVGRWYSGESVTYAVIGALCIEQQRLARCVEGA